jgi:hypothetical protein
MPPQGDYGEVCPCDFAIMLGDGGGPMRSIEVA